MAIIYSYPSVTPVVADILLITQASDPSKATKSITLSSVKTLFGLNDSLNGVGTPGHIPFFETSSRLVDSFISQDANGLVFIGSQASGTRFTNTSVSSPTLTGTDLYTTNIYGNNSGLLNIQGNAIIGNEATDSLQITSKVTDSQENNSSAAGQILLSNNAGQLVWGNANQGTVKGTGTLNFVPKWSAFDTLQDSIIFDDGTNVGIGTPSPQDKFEVQGSIYATPIGYSSNEDAYALRMGASNNIAFDMGIKIKSDSAGVPYMSLRSHNTEDLLILESGNVGIGTSGINPADKLHVMGTVRSVIDTGSGFGFLTNRGSDGSASGVRWDSNNSSLILKDSTDVITTKISSSGFSWFNGGSVGFGTKTPAAPVEMVVNDASGKGLLLSNVGDNSAYDSIRVTYSGYSAGSTECIFRPKTQPGTGIVNTYFRFKTNGSAASGNIANVTVDGKVGIGTTNDVIASQLTVGQGDIEITKFATGLILRSSNGTRYRITVANDGTLTTTAL